MSQGISSGALMTQGTSRKGPFSIDQLARRGNVTTLNYLDFAAAPPRPPARRMARARLMGAHSHETLAGVRVHVWERGGKYLARGRYQGRPFGETLGDDPAAATARLRQLLTEIEDGSYVRPSEARRRAVSSGRAPRLTLRPLVNEFLAEKRKVRGRQTADDYQARLMPVLAFAELAANRRHWPLARDIDRAFLTSLRPYLYQCQTTRNGRPGGRPRPLSPRQVANVWQSLRTLLAWADAPAVRKLPADWANPLTRDLMVEVPAKDPLRDDKLPLDVRVELVHHMDR